MKRFFKFGSPSYGVTNKTSSSEEVDDNRRKSSAGSGLAFGGLTAVRLAPNSTSSTRDRSDSISSPNRPNFQKSSGPPQGAMASISPTSSRSGGDLYVIDVLSNRDRLFTKLHKACWVGDLAKVRKAIKRTCVNDVDCEMRTPLHLAAARAHKDIVWFLLGSKAKPNFPDRDGNTPLLKAIQSRRMDIVQFLLDRGGDPNSTNLLGATGLHIAARDGLQDVASALLRNGAAVNAIDQNGCTPLLIATIEAHLDVAEILLSHGASVNIADKKQRTCLMMACEKGSTDMVQLYLGLGAQVASSSSLGMTAEDFARRSGHDACLKLLSSSSTAQKADAKDMPIVDHSPDFKNVDLDSWNDDDDIDSTGSNIGPKDAAIKVLKTDFDMSKFFDEINAESLSNKSVGSNKSVILDGNETPLPVIVEPERYVPMIVEPERSVQVLAIASAPLQLSPSPPPAPAKPKRAQSMESCVSVMDNLDFLPPVTSVATANAAIEIANKRAKDLMAELGLSDVSQFSSSDQTSVKDEDTDYELDFRAADDETKPLEIELTAFIGPIQKKDSMEEGQEQDQRLLAMTDFKIEATILPILSTVVETELEEKVSKEDSDWLESDSSLNELMPNSQPVNSKLKVVTKIDTGSNTVISSGFEQNNNTNGTVMMTSSDLICLRDLFGESAVSAKEFAELDSEEQKTQLTSKNCVSSTDGTLGRVDTLQGTDEIWLRNPCRAIPIDLGSRNESASSSSDSQRSSATAEIDATGGGIFRAELVTLTGTANSKEDDILLQTPPSKVVVPTNGDDWDPIWLRICGKLPMDGSDSIEESLAVDLEKNGKSAMASNVMDVTSMTALQNLQELSSPDDQSSLSLTDDQTYRLLVSMALVDPTPTSSIHRLASMVQHLRRAWLSEQAHARDAKEKISRLMMTDLAIKEKNAEVNSALTEQRIAVAELKRELDAAKRSLGVEEKHTWEALEELDKRREQLDLAEAKYVEEASERQKAALRARAAELQAENLQLMLADEAVRIKTKHSSEIEDLIAEIAALRQDVNKVTFERDSAVNQRDEMTYKCDAMKTELSACVSQLEDSERKSAITRREMKEVCEVLEAELKRREEENARLEAVIASDNSLELNWQLKERVAEISNVRSELARCQDNLKTVEERVTIADHRSAESEAARATECVQLTEALRSANENLVEVAAQLAAAKVREGQLGGVLEDERSHLRNAQELIRNLEERVTIADHRSAESEAARGTECVRLTEELRSADENLAQVTAQLAAAKVREGQLGGVLEDLRNAQELIRNLEAELKKMAAAPSNGSTNNLQAGHIVDGVIPGDDAITNNDVKNKNARRLQRRESTSASHLTSMMRNASVTEFDLMVNVDGRKNDMEEDDDDDYVAAPMMSSFQNRSVEGGAYCPTHSHSSWYKLREDAIERSLDDEDRRDPSSSRWPAADSRRFDVQPKSSMSVDHRNCVDRSEVDMMRQQLELKARNEMNRKLEQLNDILEQQTKSNARLDRSDSQLRGFECTAAIRELQSEVGRLHRSLEYSESRHAKLEEHCGRLCELIEAKRRVKSKLRLRTDELDGGAMAEGVEDRDRVLHHRHVCPIFDFEKGFSADNLHAGTSSFMSSSAANFNNFCKNDLRNADCRRASDLGSLKFRSDFNERDKEPIFELPKPWSVNFDVRKRIKPTRSSVFDNSLKRKFL